MPLVAAKCTSCGASLEVDSTKEAAVCPYCGTAYIVEKAINNYNTTNNITADVVNIYGGTSDFTIRAGVLEKYNGAATDVVIPSSVNVIGIEAFQRCLGLKSVTVPDSVTKIMQNAFMGCVALQSVSLPDSVTEIGYGAFQYCNSLTNITLPAGVTKIGGFAFARCQSLKSVDSHKSGAGIKSGAAEIEFAAFAE